MTDPANRLSYAGSLRIRPNISPLGPRIRNRSSNLLETGMTSPYQSDSASTPSANLSPISPLSPLSPPRHTDRKSLACITQLQVPSSHLSPLSPPHDANHLMSPSRSDPPKLTAPPSIKFDSTPIQWKSLPLEAALWTLSSPELQDIVSRAIRSSAKESFIRLLSIENLDKTLPTELDRLNALKGMTQSKYRFLVHRRTMLLQALSSNSTGHSNKDGEDSMSVVGKLTSQLSETTAECDQLVEDLVKITDHIAQITKLMDIHWASALAIALRKLNGSYGRRTAELVKARERIAQLEAELEDAWKEAEKMAKEMDEFDAVSDDEGEAIIETAEVVTVPQSPMSPQRRSLPLTPTLLNFTAPLSPPQTAPIGHMKEHIRETEHEPDVPDTVSIRSTRSARSTKSGRSYRSTRSVRGGDGTRVSNVSAAKKRSNRASESSLRFTNHSRKNSLAHPKSPHEDHPPLPNLPLQFNSPMSMNSANASSTLLHSSRQNSVDSSMNMAGHKQMNSLDGIRVLGSPPSAFQRSSVYPTVDDIYLRHQSPSEDESSIQVVPRVAPIIRASSLDRPQKVRRDVASTNIPSIWMNADAPKTPAERVEHLMGSPNTKSTPYQKLRTLTKRYSLPFPIFATKSQPSSVANRSAPH